MPQTETRPRQDAISGLQGPYRFLSNFHPSPMVFNLEAEDQTLSVKSPTAEHACQASKAAVIKDGLAILRCETPGDAKRAGRRVRHRPDWDQAKLSIMRRIVAAKFRQNPELARRLLATGQARLVETNTWNDTFWGVYRGQGQNHLGKILMDIRNNLTTDGS